MFDPLIETRLAYDAPLPLTFFLSSFFAQNCWQLNYTCLLCVEIGVVVDVCCCEQVHTACPPTATSVLQETYVMRKSRCASVTRVQNSCGKENNSLAGIGSREKSNLFTRVYANGTSLGNVCAKENAELQSESLPTNQPTLFFGSPFPHVFFLSSLLFFLVVL